MDDDTAGKLSSVTAGPENVAIGCNALPDLRLHVLRSEIERIETSWVTGMISSYEAMQLVSAAWRRATGRVVQSDESTQSTSQ